jgi:GAF domain-containing protein
MNCDKNNSSKMNLSGTDSLYDPRLAAARRRLAESRDEEDAIEGLREIVANLLGSEEIGLFRADRTTGIFQVCWSFGIDLEHYDLMQALGDAGFQRLRRGEFHIGLSSNDRSSVEPKSQAFIPIRVANQTVGVLAILRLLPQKATFDAADLELFKLLSTEAAKPLFGSAISSKQATEGQGMEA